MTMGLPRPRNRYMFGNAQKKLGKSTGGSFRCRSSSEILVVKRNALKPTWLPREVR